MKKLSLILIALCCGFGLSAQGSPAPASITRVEEKSQKQLEDQEVKQQICLLYAVLMTSDPLRRDIKFHMKLNVYEHESMINFLYKMSGKWSIERHATAPQGKVRLVFNRKK